MQIEENAGWVTPILARVPIGPSYATARSSNKSAPRSKSRRGAGPPCSLVASCSWSGSSFYYAMQQSCDLTMKKLLTPSIFLVFLVFFFFNMDYPHHHLHSAYTSSSSSNPSSVHVNQLLPPSAGGVGGNNPMPMGINPASMASSVTSAAAAQAAATGGGGGGGGIVLGMNRLNKRKRQGLGDVYDLAGQIGQGTYGVVYKAKSKAKYELCSSFLTFLLWEGEGGEGTRSEVLLQMDWGNELWHGGLSISCGCSGSLSEILRPLSSFVDHSVYICVCGGGGDEGGRRRGGWRRKEELSIGSSMTCLSLAC